MHSRFIARPPLPVKWPALQKHLKRMFCSAWHIFWPILVPFKPRPEEIEPFPEPDPQPRVTESNVRQCHWIFDQVELRRAHLEQKAQSTFSLMVFLVPLLGSIFVFIISRGAASKTLAATWLLAAISALLLLLGFLSAVRAIAVRGWETLFLDSVMHESGQFRKYNEAFHARGLLYCASMNTAMNDHIAQFVKGAHIFTAAAVVALFVAAIPASIALSAVQTAPTRTQIVGSVIISSPELTSLRDDVARLKKDIQKLSSGSATKEELRLLQDKLEKLRQKSGNTRRETRVAPAKSIKSR